MRLRVQVQATDDPASAAYSLRYQKNGSGGYVDVPVGATSVGTTPLIESGDATGTTVGTAAGTWAVSFPSAVAGDMLIAVVAWDDSTTVATVTPPTGPNGESASSIDGPIASASTEMRMQAWRWIATGSWSATTRTFTPAASETCRAVVIKVPAGEFDSTTPIGWSNTRASAGTAETTLNSPTGSAGSTDGGGRLVIAYGSDADAITAPASGTGTVNNATGGGVGLCVVTRDTAVTNSESVSAISATIAGDSWASLAFVVRAPLVPAEVYIATSTNITGGGEATTQQLTAGTGSFTTGRMWDDENGADSIDIGDDGYTELEWNLATQAPAVDTDYFDFRVYVGGSALDTYTATPRWTIGAGAVAITAAAASLVITPRVASVKVSRAVSATAGALTIAGLGATVRLGKSVSAAVAALTTTGQAAALELSKAVNAALAGLTISPQAASVVLGANIQATSQSLAVTGQTASVSADIALAAQAAAMTITGHAGTVRVAKSVSAAAATLAISPQAATVRLAKAIAAQAQALVITPRVATVTADRSVAAASASLVITGLTASLSQTTDVPATRKEMVITPQVATVRVSRAVAAVLSALTIEEFTALVGRAINVAAEAGTLTLTGHAATVAVETNAVNRADLTIATHVATIGLRRPIPLSVWAVAADPPNFTVH